MTERPPDVAESEKGQDSGSVRRGKGSRESTATAIVEGGEEGEYKDDEYIEPGLRGWLDVLGAHLANMICYGMTQSFAVFQEYYQKDVLSSSTGQAISWIGSIQYCLCPLLGCISGPLFDAGYLKHLIFTSGVLYTFCLMMTSISTEYYQVLLAHGIGTGIAMGLIFSPSVGTLSHHFSRSRLRTLGYGCQASGSAIGGIIFPSLLNYLLPNVGFRWTMRIMGFIVAGFTVIIFFCLSTTVPPRNKIAVLSPTVFRNRSYAVYVFGATLASLAMYAPLNFSVTYATSHGMPVEKANYAPAVGNGVSVVGRIVPLLAAQVVGPLNVNMTFALMSSALQFLWTLATRPTAILVFDAFYGIFSGGYAASLNLCAATFAPHTNQAGLYLGMCFFVTAFGWLVGNPISAQLIDKHPTYLPASLFGGAIIFVGGSFIVLSRFMRARQLGNRFV